MNGSQLCNVFEHITILEKFFCGIVEFRQICSTKSTTSWRSHDFLVVNVNNWHWILLMWINSKTLIVFDSLSGKFTFKKQIMKQILFNCFSRVNRICFVYGRHRLQNDDLLTCGEHVIYFILFQTLFYIENGYFSSDYISEIENYCAIHRLTPDQFVWNEIYVKLKLLSPPDLKQVVDWYAGHRHRHK